MNCMTPGSKAAGAPKAGPPQTESWKQNVLFLCLLYSSQKVKTRLNYERRQIFLSQILLELEK